MHALEGGALTLPQAIEGTLDGNCEASRRLAAFCSALCAPLHSNYLPCNAGSSPHRRIATSLSRRQQQRIPWCARQLASGPLPLPCPATPHVFAGYLTVFLPHPLAPAGHAGGYVVGEIIRRVTGCTLRDFVSRELASPLGVEFYVGIPNSQVMSRVSKVKCAVTPSSIPPPSNCGLYPNLAIAPHVAQKRRKNSNARFASATWAGPIRTRRLSKTRTLPTTTRRTTSPPPSCSASSPWWSKARPATRRSRSTARSARTWRACSIGLTF
jgi:CubicO group peptidase (beta-lactamase class C family)